MGFLKLCLEHNENFILNSEPKKHNPDWDRGRNFDIDSIQFDKGK